LTLHESPGYEGQPALRVVASLETLASCTRRVKTGASPRFTAYCGARLLELAGRSKKRTAGGCGLRSPHALIRGATLLWASTRMVKTAALTIQRR